MSDPKLNFGLFFDYFFFLRNVDKVTIRINSVIFEKNVLFTVLAVRISDLTLVIRFVKAAILFE